MDVDPMEAEVWLPAFPGQRKPFAVGNPYRAAEGNALARTHGAHSPSVVAPLAEEIIANTLTSNPHLDAVRDQSTLEAHGWAEAICVLCRRFVAASSLEDAISDTHTEESTEHHAGGTSRRSTKGRRTQSTLALLDRWEARAAKLRNDLGVTPMARAKLGRNVVATQVDMATFLSSLREQVDQEQGGQGQVEERESA